jgi:hypothetical protein
MNTFRVTASMVVTALLLVTVRAGEGAPIRFVFEGEVTRASSGGPASIGDTFSGSFSYDPDAAPTRTVPGEAYFDDSLLSLEFVLGPWTGSAAFPTPIAPLSPLGLIYDSPAALRDLLFVQDAFDTSTTHLGFSLTGVLLAWGDTTRAVFSSPVLPDTLDLPAFDFTQVSISWDGLIGSDIGVITRVERARIAVPEPSTLALVCVAGVVGALRRRIRRQV